MKLPKMIPILLLLLGAFSLHAQMERTMYQVFNVDSTERVTFEIVGEYQISTWAGSSILVETNIQIWDASPEILGFLIKEGRYDLSMDSTAGPTPKELHIFTKNRERKPIKRPDGQKKCVEICTTKIFIPDFFAISEDKTMLTRKEKLPEPGASGGEE